MRTTDYILGRFPEGLSYEDAVQVCLWLHVTLEFCPSDLREEVVQKEDLASVFAELARRGGIRNYRKFESFKYGANFHQITDKGHWLEAIASVYKKGDVLKDASQERVVEIMGCGEVRREPGRASNGGDEGT